MKRSPLLTMVLVLLAVMLAGVSVWAGGAQEKKTEATGEFSWDRYAGTKIYVFMEKNPSTQVILENLPRFEALTGIKVVGEDLPMIQQRQKLAVELSSGSGSINGFLTATHVERKAFYKAGFYYPLDEFYANPALTPPGASWDNYMPAAQEFCSTEGVQINALPLEASAHIMFYRKDLFDQAGLSKPASLAEVEQDAGKINNDDVYGFVMRGQKYAAAGVQPHIGYNYGATFRDAKGNSNLNTQEWIDSLKWYARMLRNYGPDGVVNYNWMECIALFAQGKVAMTADGGNFAGQFEDPSTSKVVGKVGYSMIPKGPKAQIPPVYGTGLAINPHSKDKEATWLFNVWSTTDEQVLLEMSKKGVIVANKNFLEKPNYIELTEQPADYIEVSLESAWKGRTLLPNISAVAEFRDIWGLAIQNAILGENVEEQVRIADESFQALLEKTGEIE